MPNISEFERNKPKETHKAFEEARKKYEAILRETTVMDDVDAARAIISCMSNHIKMMLESHRRCASAIQDAANDARKAADASADEAKQFEEMAQQAATRAVEATEAVKVLEAKLTASTAAE